MVCQATRSPKRLEGVALAGAPGALDELDDADAAAVAEHAEREAEGGGGLALAGAGVDDEEAFLGGLGGDLGVLDGLAVGHLRLWRRAAGVVDLGHRSFTLRGRPATVRITLSATAATALVEAAGGVAEAAGEGVVGDDAEAGLVRDGDPGAAGAARAAARAAVAASGSSPARRTLREPEGEAVDEDRAAVRGGGEGGGEVERGLGGVQPGAAGRGARRCGRRISASRAWAVAM